MRALWRTPVLGIAVLAAVPAVYAAARGTHDLSFAVSLATIAGAACLGFCVDDLAESTLTPCPISRATRRSVRACLITVAVGASWAVVALAADYADFPIGPLRIRIAEAAAAAMVSLAFAARAARTGSDSPGLAAVAATLLALGTCTALAIHLTWLPQLGHRQHSTRWWVLAAVAAVVAWWGSRDPAARPRLPRTDTRPAAPTSPQPAP